MNSKIDLTLSGPTGEFFQTVSFTTDNIADCKSLCRMLGDCKSFYELNTHKCHLFEKNPSKQHSIHPWIKMVTSKLGPEKRLWSERKEYKLNILQNRL